MPAGQLEGLVEVASVDTWVFLEDAHRVGILQDLYTERVLRDANQLHGLQNHCQLPQAQPGSSLCTNATQRLPNAIFSPLGNLMFTVILRFLWPVVLPQDTGSNRD